MVDIFSLELEISDEIFAFVERINLFIEVSLGRDRLLVNLTLNGFPDLIPMILDTAAALLSRRATPLTVRDWSSSRCHEDAFLLQPLLLDVEQSARLFLISRGLTISSVSE